jgi:hypothetical protein
MLPLFQDVTMLSQVPTFRRNVSPFLQRFKGHESAFFTDPVVFKMNKKLPLETSETREHNIIIHNTGKHHIPEQWNTASYSWTPENSVIFQNTGTQHHIPEQWNTASFSRTPKHSVIFQNNWTQCHIPEQWNAASYSRTHRLIPEHRNTTSYSRTLEHGVIFQNTGISKYTCVKTSKHVINAYVCFRLLKY